MSKAIFYHAGCPVCVSVEQRLLKYLNDAKVQIESVHLGEQNTRIDEAASVGVVSVPALVLDEHVYHINFGAALADLKA